VARTTHTHCPLEINLTEHGYQTHHEGCPRQNLHVGMHHPAGKMYSCHILQVLLACYDALRRDQSSKPCLLVAHHMVHFALWSDVCMTFVDFERLRTSVCKPVKVEMDFITKLEGVYGGSVLLRKL
jgi:hypothetical protein